MENVTTWQTTGGERINLTQEQERALNRALTWPASERTGEFYLTRGAGEHKGEPTYTDSEISEICKGEV